MLGSDQHVSVNCAVVEHANPVRWPRKVVPQALIWKGEWCNIISSEAMSIPGLSWFCMASCTGNSTCLVRFLKVC